MERIVKFLSGLVLKNVLGANEKVLWIYEPEVRELSAVYIAFPYRGNAIACHWRRPHFWLFQFQAIKIFHMEEPRMDGKE
jgi:hypothetical protein